MQTESDRLKLPLVDLDQVYAEVATLDAFVVGKDSMTGNAESNDISSFSTEVERLNKEYAAKGKGIIPSVRKDLDGLLK